VIDIHDDTVKQAEKDCADFRDDAGDLLDGIDESQAAHDFWLTRNGHGAGFWDRGLGKVGQKLTKIAKDFGSVDLYVGDDGTIYGT
jgi:hypothetical protein